MWLCSRDEYVFILSEGPPLKVKKRDPFRTRGKPMVRFRGNLVTSRISKEASTGLGQHDTKYIVPRETLTTRLYYGYASGTTRHRLCHYNRPLSSAAPHTTYDDTNEHNTSRNCTTDRSRSPA